MMWLTLLSLALAGESYGDPPPMPWPGDPEPGPPHPPTGNSMGKTCAGHSFDEPPDEHYMQAVRQRSRGLTPWAPLRRVADPEKKRARKAQKKARRAGR